MKEFLKRGSVGLVKNQSILPVQILNLSSRLGIVSEIQKDIKAAQYSISPREPKNTAFINVDSQLSRFQASKPQRSIKPIGKPRNFSTTPIKPNNLYNLFTPKEREFIEEGMKGTMYNFITQCHSFMKSNAEVFLHPVPIGRHPYEAEVLSIFKKIKARIPVSVSAEVSERAVKSQNVIQEVAERTKIKESGIEILTLSKYQIEVLLAHRKEFFESKKASGANFLST